MDTARVFTYHKPTAAQQTRYVAIRDKAKELADLIQSAAPNSREQSLAMTRAAATLS